MKDFFNYLKKRAAGVGELLEETSPSVKSSIAEIGRGVIEKTSAVKNVLEQRSAQAGQLAHHVIASPQAQAIPDGFIQATGSVSGAVAHALKDERNACPAPESKGDEESKLEKAIEKLNGRDKVGVSAEVAATAGGVAAGAAAAGAIASAAGATTLLGSSGLASLFGGIFVATTPVGWVIGSAVVAGATGYGLMKLARSGAKQDIVRKEMIERLTDRLSALQRENSANSSIVELQQLIALTLASDFISEDQARRMVVLVENGALNLETAIIRLRALALQAEVIEVTSSAR
jgi:hypothetical protein